MAPQCEAPSKFKRKTDGNNEVVSLKQLNLIKCMMDELPFIYDGVRVIDWIDY